jgi:hypothetical protein
MDQSRSWEANSHSAGQEIPRLFCTEKFIIVITRQIPLVPILSQMNPVHNLEFLFFTNHFNIIPHLRLCLPSGFFPSGNPTEDL